MYCGVNASFAPKLLLLLNLEAGNSGTVAAGVSPAIKDKIDIGGARGSHNSGKAVTQETSGKIYAAASRTGQSRQERVDRLPNSGRDVRHRICLYFERARADLINSFASFVIGMRCALAL
jgi:hypothetical protein